MRRIWVIVAPLLISTSLGSAPKAGVDRSAAPMPGTQIVTHELTPSQLQEDFGRLRFSLEHADAGLYRYTSKAEMNARFDAVAAQLNQPMTDLDFYRLLSPLIASIRNSHTSISPPADTLKSVLSYDRAFPLVLRYRDGRAYVEANLSTDASIRPGMELVALNGQSMADVTQNLMRSRPAEGFADETKYGRLDEFFWEDLLLHVGSSARYTLQVRDPTSGATRLHVVNGVAAKTVAAHVHEFPPAGGPSQSLAIEPDSSTAVMRLKNFIDPSTDAFFRTSFHTIAASGVKNLILDLRGNHGGVDWYNSDLLSYISAQPFRFYRERTLKPSTYEDIRYLTYTLDDFLLPDQIAALPSDVRERPFERWTLRQLVDYSLATDHAGGVQQPKTQDRFVGHVYLLIDHLSGSSAAEVPAMMQHLGLATIIGEEPNGSYQGETAGIIPGLRLPNSKLVIRVPLLLYQNEVMPGVREGRGAEPTFTVAETLEDSIAGVDTAMTFTRALIRAREPATSDGRADSRKWP